MSPILEEIVVFLFDVDGVIADTPHQDAWKSAAIEWKIITEDFNFTKFYAEQVAGEPGVTGAENILSMLRKEGMPTYYERENISDSTKKYDLAIKFREVKQQYLNKLIEGGKFHVYYDIINIIIESKDARIPLAAVSSSENAKGILEKIYASKTGEELRISYAPDGNGIRLYNFFDTTALGAITYWHGAKIEKINHYAMAYGKLLGKINRDNIPYAIVFEDAPKGVSAVRKLGFYCIGISRVSISHDIDTRKDLLNAGANLVYSLPTLIDMDYQQLRTAIAGILPIDVDLNLFDYEKIKK